MEVMDLEALKGRVDLLEKIDWELTPQQAVEMFSLKSRGMGPRFQVRSSREKRYYFCVDNWGDRPHLVLKERSIGESRSIADIESPLGLLEACVEANGGGKGVYPLSKDLRDWLQGQLSF